jgi:hypothetical protein
MPDNAKPPQEVIADPAAVRQVWDRCRDVQPRTARIRAELEAGTYDPYGAKEAVAMERLADAVLKPNLATVIAGAMDDEHAEDARGARENFGASEDEEENVGERWDGLS